MHTIIHNQSSTRRSRIADIPSQSRYRKPNYDCREHPDVVKLVVYTPGIDASGVEIEARGPDLVITARKERFVRVNWQSLHLETAQRDYQLRLRLGNGVDFAALQAEITDGVLTLILPKRTVDELPAGLRRVA